MMTFLQWLRFALWNIGIKVCDHLPNQHVYTCWVHPQRLINGIYEQIPERAWERWGWDESAPSSEKVG